MSLLYIHIQICACQNNYIICTWIYVETTSMYINYKQCLSSGMLQSSACSRKRQACHSTCSLLGVVLHKIRLLLIFFTVSNTHACVPWVQKWCLEWPLSILLSICLNDATLEFISYSSHLQSVYVYTNSLLGIDQYDDKILNQMTKKVSVYCNSEHDTFQCSSHGLRACPPELGKVCSSPTLDISWVVFWGSVHM